MQNDNQINKVALRQELVDLEARIHRKIRDIVCTHRHLPFDRLTKGRLLREHVSQTIKYLDQGNESKLSEYIGELVNRGVKIKNYET
jgi:hypothetical protein